MMLFIDDPSVTFSAKEITTIVLYIASICGSVIVSSATVGWWLGRKVIRVETAIKTLEEFKADTMTIPMAEATALRMAIENPGIRVPDPRRPGQVIVVAGKAT
jgi:hypothetical protein